MHHLAYINIFVPIVSLPEHLLSERRFFKAQLQFLTSLFHQFLRAYKIISLLSILYFLFLPNQMSISRKKQKQNISMYNFTDVFF